MNYVNSKTLNNSAGAPITALALTNAVPVTSESINVESNVGFLVLTVQENKPGAGGNVDIYAQYSDDNVTFNKAYVSDLAGSLVQDGNIVTALGNATRRMVFTARLGRYVNFVFSPNADSQVTASVTFQESDR